VKLKEKYYLSSAKENIWTKERRSKVGWKISTSRALIVTICNKQMAKRGEITRDV
jgi:hypothetical protein